LGPSRRRKTAKTKGKTKGEPGFGKICLIVLGEGLGFEEPFRTALSCRFDQGTGGKKEKQHGK